MLKDDILKIMVYINFNSFADLDKSITEVAQQCGFSLATYSRKFKQVSFSQASLPEEVRDKMPSNLLIKFN